MNTQGGSAKGINNFYQYNDLLAAGGQPSEQQIRVLKEEGYEAIVNISPVTTRNYFDGEAALIEELNMHYIHFPVDCGNLQEIQYFVFRNILDGLKGNKVFVHCGGNIKSSNLIHMYQTLEEGVDESQSLQSLKKIQQPEEKWFSFFQKLGMKGLQ